MTGRSIGALSIGGAIFGLAWSAQGADPPKDRLIASIRGRDLYKTYCAECHGPKAKGDGPKAATLKVSPPDLTRISERHGGTFPLMLIERIISGDEELPHGHGPMPVWGPVFSQVDRDQDLGRIRIDNLARYLRDIQSK